MVQERSVGDGNACRRTIVPSTSTVDSSDDDANRTRHFSVTERARVAVPMPPLQALEIYSNILACELKYRVDSGEVFQATRTHPEAREFHKEDHLTCALCRPSIDAIEAMHLTHALADFHHEDTVSESGQARGLRRSGCHSPTPKRKRRGSTSTNAALRTKRRPATNGRATIKSDYDSDPEDEKEELNGTETELQQIRIDEVYPKYYDLIFRAINQLVCKDILKLWIKAAHPRKQTLHPYNGGELRGARSQAKYGYPGHYSKPDYWPSDFRPSDRNWKAEAGTACRHREPDHLFKPERIRLLIHLLRSQNRGFKHGKFDLKKLKQSTDNFHLKGGEHWTPEVIERLEEVYWIRDKEMQFERKEIDGGTLVSVQMPKRRCKVRKSPKPAVKSAQAASLPSLQLKKEPQDPSSTTRNAPVANMGTHVETEDEAMDLSEESALSILVDTSSSTEEVAPSASCPGPILWEAGTIQDGLPCSDSSSPTDGQSWTSQSADRGRDPTVFTHPNHFGSIATPGVDQRSLPLCDQYRFGSSSMQDFPSQVVRRQYGHGPSVSERVAPRRRPNRSSPRSPAAWPVGPEVENIHYPAFAASSAGLAGYFSPPADHTSWQTNDLWDAQIDPSVYSAVPDPTVSPFPYEGSSFSSGYGDPTLSSGLPSDTRNNGNQSLIPPYPQGLNEDFRRLTLQTVGNPQYQPLGTNAPSGNNSDPANQSYYPPHFRPHASLCPEYEFDPFSQNQ